MTVQTEYDRITFSLPHSMNASLDKLKKEMRISKSDIIKQAIESYLKKREEEKLAQAIDLMAEEYRNNNELTFLADLDNEDFQ
ncbi:MAG: ribbon-helix-helix protein, CopG family [Sulfurovum sp.]|nr:ribbon-helix-helix protein, CopG family [Sulfurovum sp.]